MENDQSSQSPSAAPPTLPPRVAPPVSDVWQHVEVEPDLLHHHVESSQREQHTWLLPSRAAAVLATTGWSGGVLAHVLLLGALMPAFDTGDTRNFLVPLDESPWFSACFIVSSLLAYMGWLWWAMSAAFNVRRVAPLATSPWLPTLVYLGGPVIVLGGLDMTGNAASSVVFVGLSWVGLGHIAVVASFKSAALRIGASTDEFSKLIWLPLAGVCYRLFVSVVLDFVDPEFRTTPLLLGLGVVGGLFLVGIALSTWRATESFDAACRRLNTRNFGAGLPSVDVITSALRKVNT